MAGALAAVAAHAMPTPPVYSISSLSGFAPTLFSSYTTSGNAATVTNSVVGLYLAPAGVAAGQPYVYVSPSDGQIDVKVNAQSFSFLWGSPDSYNQLVYHTTLGDFAYTGNDLASQFGMAITGNPALSTVFTASLLDGGSIKSVSFRSQNIAFEVDGVRRVPEPGSVALVGAALGALAWTQRRRRKA